MKYWIWILWTGLLTGCASLALNLPTPAQDIDHQTNQTTKQGEAYQTTANLKDYGKAPEWHNDTWVNTDRPLYLDDLQGKVILLEMWTFG